jgi:hypothetical protein
MIKPEMVVVLVVDVAMVASVIFLVVALVAP